MDGGHDRQHDIRQLLVDGTAEDSSRFGARTSTSEKERLRRLAVRNLSLTLTCTSCMLSLYGGISATRVPHRVDVKHVLPVPIIMRQFDFGITAWTVLLIKSRGADGVSTVYEYLAQHSEVLGILVACVAFGGIIGGILGGKMGKANGRKAEIRLVNLLCITGASLEALSGTETWTSWRLVTLYAIGRVLYGVGLGLSLRCGPMYLRETVTASFRDIAVVSVKLSMVSGMIVSYVVGGLLDNAVLGYCGSIVMALTSLACVSLLPESPLFMLLHEEKYSRQRILDAVRFTEPSATEEDLQALQEEILNEISAYTPGQPSYLINPKSKSATAANTGTAAHEGPDETCHVIRGGGGSLSSEGTSTTQYVPGEQEHVSVAEAVKKLPSLTEAPGMRAAILLTAGLMVFEQASGMTAILYYGGVFLADISFLPVDWGLALLGLLQLAAAVAVIKLINPVGRKPLMLHGLLGLLVSAASLTVGGFLGFKTGGRWWALIGLYGFTASYSISLGALVWVLVAEVFPTCHRAQAISIVSAAHFTSCAVVVILLPLVQDMGGYSYMFLCFLIVAIFANIFAHRYMVETRGLTLLEIQHTLSIRAGFPSLPELQSASV